MKKKDKLRAKKEIKRIIRRGKQQIRIIERESLKRTWIKYIEMLNYSLKQLREE